MLIGFGIGLESLFYTAMTPLLPTFRSDLGLSEAALGYLVGSYAVGLVAFALPSGYLISRFGARSTTIAALGLMAANTVGFGWSSTIEALMVTRTLQGASGALLATGAMAWLVEGTPRNRHGAAVGFAMTATVGGTLIGPVLGAAMAVVGLSAICTILGLLAILVSALMLRIPATPRSPAAPMRATLKSLVTFPALSTTMVVCLTGIIAGAVVVIVPLRLDDAGYGPEVIGGVFLLIGLVKLVVGPRVGRATDVLGPRRPIIATLTSAGIVLLLLAPLHHGPATVSLMFVLYPSLNALLTAAFAALVGHARRANLSSEAALACGNLTWAGGELVGSVGVGLSLEHATAEAALVVLACASVGLAVLLWQRPSLAMP